MGQGSRVACPAWPSCVQTGAWCPGQNLTAGEAPPSQLLMSGGPWGPRPWCGMGAQLGVRGSGGLWDPQWWVGVGLPGEPVGAHGLWPPGR